MTVEFEEFLKLYTYHDDVQSFLLEFEHSNKKEFRFGKESSTTHDAYLLSKDIQTRFQYSCMSIASLKSTDEDEIQHKEKKTEIIKDLISNVAYILDNKAKISNLADFNSRDIAHKVVEEVFTPLCAATEEVSAHLVLKPSL